MPYLIPESIVQGSKLLCANIIEGYGGLSAISNSLVSKKIFCDRRNVEKWKNQGFVPLTQVYDVARLLKEDPWALSYIKLMAIHGESSPSFVSVVNNTRLLPIVKRTILETYENPESLQFRRKRTGPYKEFTYSGG